MRVYGSGHVVAYNYVANFHDGIDVETYGNPDGSGCGARGPSYPPRKDWDVRPVAIDFYNNLLTNFHDNAIEIDGSMHNIRVMRNLMLNSASHPVLQSARDRRPRVLDSQCRLQRAVRRHANEFRRRRRRVPQQHDVQRIRGADIRRCSTWRTISSWVRTRTRRSSRSIRSRITATPTTTDSGRVLPRRILFNGHRRRGARCRTITISSRPWTPERW